MLHLGHKTTRPLRSPALLVLDEPCQGLDEVNRRTMLNLIHYIAESSGTTLLYVTHHATDQVPCIKRQLTMGNNMPNMHKLEVRKSGIHGKGIYAIKPIKKGVQIGTYHGEITDEDDTYVLWITDEDGNEYGVNGTSDLKFLNHSHEPNAEFDGEELHALRTIKAGEEITFHYGETFVDWLEGK